MNFDNIFSLANDNEWFKPKQLSMYKDFAFRAAQESYALRKKAGAVILSPKGSLFIGYNGTPAGHDNCCEDEQFLTKDIVIHAEDNAIRKMINENVDPTDSIIFITDSPCNGCSTNVILKHGIKAVIYFRLYRDMAPINTLNDNGVITQYVDDNYIEELRKYILLKDLEHAS